MNDQGPACAGRRWLCRRDHCPTCAISCARSSGPREPKVARHHRRVLSCKAALAPELIAPALQVIGIWLQLLNIAEENAAMRARRRLETHGGQDQLIGSLSNAFSPRLPRPAIEPEAVASALETAYIAPTITAHPTEAKRVTVLEIHRRIYLKLYETGKPALDAARAAGADPGAEQRYRPSLDDRRNQARKADRRTGDFMGSPFLPRSALFDRTAAICDLLESALARHYPELRSPSARPCVFLLDRRRPRRQSLS